MKKGCIYKFKKPNRRHPFIFIRHIDEYTFVGCMITHMNNSEEFSENLQMSAEYFKVFVKEGSPAKYPIQYESSNLVRLYLIKQICEADDKVWGKLTLTGIGFVDLEITKTELTYCSEK